VKIAIQILKTIVPFLLLAAGAYGAWKLIESRPEVQTEVAAPIVPLVRVVTAENEDVQLRVVSQGTVKARVVSELVPEVAGRIVYVSPSLVAGGFFEKDEVLLRIESHDYELALIRYQAEVAQTRLRLEQERAEAEVALKEWEELGKGEEAAPLVLRKPQIAQAEAALEAAQATLDQARRDLERTEIRAPYTGRVRQENVDIGQYVGRGQSVAQLYSVDVAEVRVPLPDEELAFVKIPLSYRDSAAARKGPRVLLKARFAGKEHTWQGRVVRTEGEIDPTSRMLYAIVEVEDPYGYGPDPNRPPLAVGMFVEAEILGNWAKDVIVLPRSAVHGQNTVYVIDEEERLRIRSVEILKRDRDSVIVRAGVEPGELICLSPMETVVDGMPVRTTAEEAAS
jgi:RND family efflux transporter MFP subunit